MPNFCCGCTNCLLKGEEFCPHHEVIAPIKKLYPLDIDFEIPVNWNTVNSLFSPLM